MIRALRIALANWIMPKPRSVVFQFSDMDSYEIRFDQMTETMKKILAASVDPPRFTINAYPRGSLMLEFPSEQRANQ